MPALSITQCNRNHDPDDECEKLYKEIMEGIFRNKRGCNNGGTHGLKFRYEEQRHGKNGPGTKSWIDHQKAIEGQQKGIQKRIKDYNDNDCNDKLGGKRLPQEARNWAYKQMDNETMEELWDGINNTNEKSILDWTYWEELTGLTGVALVLYLIISEGSRIFPPRNAVPIP